MYNLKKIEKKGLSELIHLNISHIINRRISIETKLSRLCSFPWSIVRYVCLCVASTLDRRLRGAATCWTALRLLSLNDAFVSSYRSFFTDSIDPPDWWSKNTIFALCTCTLIRKLHTHTIVVTRLLIALIPAIEIMIPSHRYIIIVRNT